MNGVRSLSTGSVGRVWEGPGTALPKHLQQIYGATYEAPPIGSEGAACGA